MKKLFIVVSALLIGSVCYGQEALVEDGAHFEATVPSTTGAIRSMVGKDYNESMKGLSIYANSFGDSKGFVGMLLLMAYYDGRKDAYNQAMLEVSELRDLVAEYGSENSPIDIPQGMLEIMQLHKQKAVANKQEVARSMLHAMGLE